MSRFGRSGRAVGLVLAVGLLLAAAGSEPSASAPGPLAAPADESGYRRFVKAVSERAKAAGRKKDWPAAEAAWLELLELDPRSDVALSGLVDLAQARKDVDGEALSRRELHPLWEAHVAEGDAKLAKTLEKSLARWRQIDPLAGEAEVLLTGYREALAALGAGYQEDGWPANAVACWSAHLALVAPGSAAESVARAAIEACLAAAPDWLARLPLAPDDTAGGKSQEWIDAHDAKTAKWTAAARFDTPHYRIRCNAGWRLAHGAARVIEQVHAFYREIWGVVPDPPPAKPDPRLLDITVPTIDVNIYGSQDEYRRRSGGPEWSGGLFNGSAVETFDHSRGRGQSSRATYRTLFHEASHQFMSVCVGSTPSFINEGVACLFEGIEILPNGTIVRDLPVSHYLSDLVPRLKAGLSLADYMGGPKADANDPEFYAPRWGFVFFLRNYVDAQGLYVFRERLPAYIQEFKRGTLGNTVEHFEEFYLEPLQVPGLLNFAQFEATWKQWLLDLQEDQRKEDKRLDEYLEQAEVHLAKKDWDTALRFLERVLDIDADQMDALAGVAEACEARGEKDRATFCLRRFLELAPEKDARRRSAEERLAQLDPRQGDRSAARRRLVGGMAGLAARYDAAGMPRNAMRIGHDVLGVDPYEPSARALVRRLERETGLAVVRWERLFNGFDLGGFYLPAGDTPFFVDKGVLVSDFSRVTDPDAPEPTDKELLYRTLFLDRDVRGDWSLEVTIRTNRGWEIVGVCFGAKSGDRFEGVVLRHTGAGRNNVDLATFDGQAARAFRGDGSFKADYDPSREAGVLLRIDVANRKVSVSLDGQPVTLVQDGRNVSAIQYPIAALRGDIGLLASRGVARFTDLRVRMGAVR